MSLIQHCWLARGTSHRNVTTRDIDTNRMRPILDEVNSKQPDHEAKTYLYLQLSLCNSRTIVQKPRFDRIISSMAYPA